ncbi:MAG: glycerophosphodiester phosphodiesterase family protein, partial [Rhodothermales bacterium]
SLPSGEPVEEGSEQNYRIYEMTYDSVATFDCGSRGKARFPRPGAMPTSKPLLRDVIEASEAYAEEQGLPDVRYNIETKSSPDGDGVLHPDPETFTRLLYNVLEETDPASSAGQAVRERATIQSFDPRTLQVAHRLDPSLSLALLVAEEQGGRLEEQLDALGFTPAIYSPDYHLVDADLVEAAHARGMLVIPWTVNTLDEMQQLQRLGVDGLITDYPDIAQALSGEE